MTTEGTTTITSTANITSSTTLINNGIINVKIEEGGPHLRHRRHHHGSGTTTHQVAPPPPPPAIAAPPRYDADGNRVLTFTDNKGGNVTLTEDKDHNVTLVMRDNDGTIITHSNVRGFDSQTIAGGHSYTNDWWGDTSRVTCGANDGIMGHFSDWFRGKQVTDNVSDAVTRDQLQTFFGHHAGLAAKLHDVPLPVTLMGGTPITLSQALATPSSYRACPVDQRDLVVMRKGNGPQ